MSEQLSQQTNQKLSHVHLNEENLNEDHLSEEQLHELSRNPDRPDLASYRLHIASCSLCREKLDLLQNMQSKIYEHAEAISAVSSNSSLKAKLHASSHQYAVDVSLESNNNQASLKTNKESSSSSWLASLLQIKIPAFSAPAIAAASFMFAFVFINAPSETKNGVTSFQDSNVLVLQAPPSKPGLGFFHQDGLNEKLVENYSGFQVVSEGKYINIRWQAIAEAVKYKIELFEISDGVSQSVKKLDTASTSWQLDREQLRPGQLYRLNLTGTTSDNYRFRHTGGFILR